MSSVPATGRLGEAGLAGLLISLLQQRFSGEVELRRERVRKRVALRDGLPVLAESSRPSESLASLLQRTGRISVDQAEQLNRRAQERDGKELESALELRLLPPKELLVALGDHVRLCLRDVFGWQDGEFTTCEASEAESAASTPGIDPVPLVQEGIESHWGPERTFAALAGRASRPAVLADADGSLGRRLRRDPGVERLLESLDGTRTLAEALQRGGTPRALAAAWVLDALGALHGVEVAAPDPAPAAAPKPTEIEVVVGGQDGRARGPARPEAGDDAKPSNAEAPRVEDLRNEVQRLHSGLADLDYYELLGVDRKADAAAIKRAYVRAAKRLHPDALARLGLQDLKLAANEVFARLSRAHVTLSNPSRRKEYDASLEEGTREEAERLLRAEMMYRKAEVLLRAGRFKDAVPLLEACVSLWPEECVYQSDYGWALFKQPQPDPEKAHQALEQAVCLDPRNALALFRLSFVLAALGQEHEARLARGRAQRLDPTIGRR